MSTTVNISDDDRAFLQRLGPDPVYRQLMSSDEIRRANALVKKDLVHKGRSDEKRPKVIYYVPSHIYSSL